MPHTELGLRERRTIEDRLNAMMSVDRIAAEIGRHRSTVFREIKRNRYVDDELPKLNGYYGMTAQKSDVERRGRRRKLVRFVDLRTTVIEQLKAGWSPEQIAGRLRFDGQPVRVSHETIYAYVYGPYGQSEALEMSERQCQRVWLPWSRLTRCSNGAALTNGFHSILFLGHMVHWVARVNVGRRSSTLSASAAPRVLQGST